MATEAEKLRIALVKESKAYRDFWKESKEKIQEAGDQIHKAGGFAKAFRENLPAVGVLSEFAMQLRSFGIFPVLSPKGMEALNPGSEHIPQPLPDPAVVIVEGEGSPINTEGPWPERALYLKPSERLLKVDLSRKRGDLIKDLEQVLETVLYYRESKELPKSWRENYSRWDIDKSRFRAEAWQALEVWRLRRKRKTYREIARTLKIRESTAKKAFIRAYELIENRPYDPEIFKRENQAIHLPELRKTCETCPLRDTCTELCPDVLQFVEQDQVKQRELCVENID